jgi:hypothetical protein
MRTVQRKLDDGLYKSPEEFVGDVRLIWANAKLYNPPGAPENARVVRIIRMIQPTRWLGLYGLYGL